MKRVILAIMAVAGLSTCGAPHSDGPPVGVYDCYGPELAAGTTLDISLAGAEFAVLSPGVYRSRAGKTGHFAFDGLTLSMVDGPYTGIKYHKETPAWTFRELRDGGADSPFMCPLNTTKDRDNPNAW